MKVLLAILSLLILSLKSSHGADPTFTISLNNPTPVQYCTSPVFVADKMSIEGSPNLKGMKISFGENYVYGEDVLEVVNPGTLAQLWDPAKGTLSLSGSTLMQDYIDAIRTVRYKNTKNIPTLGTRKIIISLDDVDYLSETGHFYRFVDYVGIKWTTSRDIAAATTYYGLKGYLATITSQAENDFIRQKTKGVGWIGASDAAVEGEWRWVTGPEGLEDSGKGRFFWKGTGVQAKTLAGYGAQLVNGVPAYQNWNRWDTPYSASLPTGTWEPNQSGDEDYAHITVFPGNTNDSYKWNDLPDAGGSGDYVPKGYLIEFGGTPGDPIVNLIATAELQVNTMLYSTSPIPEICEGNSTTLNMADNTSATYSWAPIESLSSPTMANPVASPVITTTYSVTGTRGVCSASTNFTVTVNPKPVSLLKPEENICAGSSVTLDPGVFQSYDWSTGVKTQNITVSTAGDYSVKLTSAKGCSAIASSKVIVHQYPTLTYNFPKLYCGDDKTATLNFTTNASSYQLESVGNTATVNDLTVSVPQFGIYSFKYTANHQYCPSSNVVELSFYPKPIVHLGNDTTICNPANILLDAGPAMAVYDWSTGEKSRTITIASQGNYRVNVTDPNGCSNGDTIKVDFTNKPKIDLSKVEKLICGAFATTLDVSADKNVQWLLQSDNPKPVISNLSINLPPDNSGKYPFTLTATDQFSCATNAGFEIGFYKVPKVDLTIDDQKCYGYNLEASYVGDADPSLANFTWVFGGDTIVNGTGRNHEKIPLGVNQAKRDLTLTVTQDGCSDHHTISDIRVIPTLSLSVKDSVRCQPDPFEFLASNTETGVSYVWNFGDNSDGTGNSPSHVYAKEGFYDVQVTVTTNKNCTNTATVSNMVHVAPVPTNGFSLDPGSCLSPGENQVSYSGSAGTADTYFWDLSELDRQEVVKDPLMTQGPLVFNLIKKPTAVIGLKVTSHYGCQGLPKTLTIKRKPDFSLNISPMAGCIPLQSDFTATVNDPVDKVTFNWDFGDGTSGTGPRVTHTYNIPEKGYLPKADGKSSLTGCYNTFTAIDSLRTYPMPKADFTIDNKVVYNDNPVVNFTDTSMGVSDWLWSFGDGTTSTDKNPTHHYNKTGHQKVLLQVFNPYQCTDTISQNLLVAFDRLFPPNAFSPNAPNIIDRSFTLGSEGIAAQGYSFKVISRWNDIVFEANNEIVGWDGRLKNGGFAPPGNYIWILKYTDFLGRRHQQTGSVTLIY